MKPKKIRTSIPDKLNADALIEMDEEQYYQLMASMTEDEFKKRIKHFHPQERKMAKSKRYSRLKTLIID